MNELVISLLLVCLGIGVIGLHYGSKAKVRANMLEAAIRKHKEQREDDRCWMDDFDLYTAIDPEYTIEQHKQDAKLPAKQVFLSNCERFYECRQAGVPYQAFSVNVTILQYQKRIAELEKKLGERQ